MLVWLGAAIIVILLLYIRYSKSVEGYIGQWTYEEGRHYPADEFKTTIDMPLDMCLNDCAADPECKRVAADIATDARGITTCSFMKANKDPEPVGNRNKVSYTKNSVVKPNVGFETIGSYDMFVMTNVAGKELASFNLDRNQCRDKCDEIDQCNAYITDHHEPIGTDKRCILKKIEENINYRDSKYLDDSSITNVSLPYGYCNGNDTTSPKIDDAGSNCKTIFSERKTGVKIKGNDLFSYTNSNVEDCAQTCKATKGCAAYTMGGNDAICYIKSALEPIEMNAEFISYEALPFGYCFDKVTAKKDDLGTNCPAIYGYCADDKTKKTDQFGSNCIPFTREMSMTIKDKTIASFSDMSNVECKSKCIALASCQAYSVDKTGLCELKSTVQDFEYSNNNISSLKAPSGLCPNDLPKFDAAGSNCANILTSQNNIDYPGNDIFTTILPTSHEYDGLNVGTCSALCDITPGCKGITYNIETNICSVKNKLENKRADSKVNAGIKRNFGYCADGISIKQDGLGGHCFGSCEMDSSVWKADKEGSNCFAKTNFGLCADLVTEKTDVGGSNCLDSCPNDASIWKMDVSGSNCYGQCNDSTTWKNDKEGSECFGPCPNGVPGFKKSMNDTCYTTMLETPVQTPSFVPIDVPIGVPIGVPLTTNTTAPVKEYIEDNSTQPLFAYFDYDEPLQHMFRQKTFFSQQN